MQHRIASLIGMGALLLIWGGVSGCGGGGDSSNGSPSTPPATSLLTPKAGQTWVYQVSATITNGGVTTPISGTLTDSNASTSVPGASLQSVVTGTLTGGGQTDVLSTVQLIQVDGSGNENVVALQDSISSAPHPLTTPILAAPGTFSASFSYSQGATTTDTHTPYSATFTVVGQETVTVPAGTFKTWKVTATTIEDTATSNETEWWAPELGNFVKDVIVQNDSTTPGLTLNATAVLTSTNVPH